MKKGCQKQSIKAKPQIKAQKTKEAKTKEDYRLS